MTQLRVVGSGLWSVKPAGAVSQSVLFLPHTRPAFNASYTPDLANGSAHAMVALTGAVTVNAPVFTGGGLVDGLILIFRWLQDATGSRVVTYVTTAGGFHQGTQLAAPTTTLSTTNIDVFMLNAGNGFWELFARNSAI